MRRVAVTVYGLVGAGLVVSGVWQWSPPAALVLAGAFMLADSWIAGARLPGVSQETRKPKDD
jgi:hypothetical protein